MDKAFRIAKWVAINGLIAYAAYLGAVKGHEGWGRVFLLVFWLSFALQALFAAYADRLEEKHMERYRPPIVPAGIRAMYDISLAIMLAYAGWMFTAFAVVVAMATEQHMVVKVGERYEQIRNELNSEEALNADGRTA